MAVLTVAVLVAAVPMVAALMVTAPTAAATMTATTMVAVETMTEADELSNRFFAAALVAPVPQILSTTGTCEG